MELSDQLQDLLGKAYFDISEIYKETLSIYKKQPYDHSKLPLNKDQLFLFLDKDEFFNRISDILQAENLMEPNCVVDVRPFNAIKEVWGYQFHIKDPNGFFVSYSIWLNSKDPLKYRFALIKELCQIYCDRKFGAIRVHGKIPNIIKPKILDELLEQMKNLHIGHNFQLQQNEHGNNYTEFLAFFMAINVFFPKEQWSNFASITSPFLQGAKYPRKYNNCLKALSDCYQVPKSIISFFDKLILPYYLSKGF